MKIEEIAKVVHEACRVVDASSQKNTPIWSKEKAFKKDRSRQIVSYFLKEGNATPAAIHEFMCARMAEEGWQYGEKKDESKKLHPCMVKFSDLPNECKFKGALVSAIINACYVPEVK